MSNSKKLFWPFSLIAVSVLIGCGGEEVSSSSDYPSLTVAHAFSSATPDASSPINLAPYVQGQGVTLASVQPIHVEGSGQACQVGEVAEMSFKATVSGSALCQYTYYVEDSQGQQAQASVVVLASSATELTLPPLSQVMENNQTLTADIDALLGPSFPTGYTLADDYILMGSGDVTLDTINTDIEFKSQDEGLHRIIYTLEEVGTNNMVLGAVDISVSDELNERIIAADNATYYNVQKPSSLYFPITDQCISIEPASSDVIPDACERSDLNQSWILEPTSHGADIFYLKNERTDQCMRLMDTHGDIAVGTCRNVIEDGWALVDTVDDTYLDGKLILRNQTSNEDDTYLGNKWDGNGIWSNHIFTLPDGEPFEQPLHISSIIETGIENEIDITPYVVAADGDDFGLTDVLSMDGVVDLSDPSDPMNKKFKFTAPTSGHYDITYVVSDHRGGSDIGVLRVTASAVSNQPGNSDLVFQDNTYMAPIYAEEAESKGLAYTGTYADDISSDDSGVYEVIATFNHEHAVQYCNSMGAVLPSAEALKNEAFNTSPTPKQGGWPTGLSYWADSNNVVSLEDKSESYVEVGSQYYVTCVSSEPYRLVSVATDGEADEDGKDVVLVTVVLTDDSKTPLEGETLNASVTGEAQLKEQSVTTNASGEATFELVNGESESVTLSVDYAELRSNTTVEFTGGSSGSFIIPSEQILSQDTITRDYLEGFDLDDIKVGVNNSDNIVLRNDTP